MWCCIFSIGNLLCYFDILNFSCLLARYNYGGGYWIIVCLLGWEFDRYNIVEGEHSLWKGVSRPYSETIRAFLVYFQNEVGWFNLVIEELWLILLFLWAIVLLNCYYYHWSFLYVAYVYHIISCELQLIVNIWWWQLEKLIAWTSKLFVCLFFFLSIPTMIYFRFFSHIGHSKFFLCYNPLLNYLLK